MPEHGSFGQDRFTAQHARRHLRPWLAVVLALVLALASTTRAGEGVVTSDQAELLEDAKEAIGSHKGGVFVIRVDATHRLARWVVWHIFTVEEVLKPFRDDDGVYFVPLTINERTPGNGKSRLEVGERYLLVARLQWAAWSRLYVEKALHLEGEDEDELLRNIRADVDEHAVYGSSSDLHLEQGGDVPGLSKSGVATPHANGLVDPEPFGMTREVVRQAAEAGKRVLLVSFVASRPPDTVIRDEFFADVVEVLSGESTTDGFWMRDPEPFLEKFPRNKKMPFPYRLPAILLHRRYVVIVDPRVDGLPELQHILPVIHEDGPTVRKIRSWLQDEAGDGSGSADVPLPPRPSGESEEDGAPEER